MEGSDTLPTPRMHWMQLVLGRGHPIVIIVVLALVGAGICGYSLQQISIITQAPTRYSIHLDIHTQGCGDRRLKVTGDIGSFGASFLQFGLLGENRELTVLSGCLLRSVVVRSNLELQAASLAGPPALFRVSGVDVDVLANLENVEADSLWGSGIVQDFTSRMIDGTLIAVGSEERTDPGPSFSARGFGDENPPEYVGQPRLTYEASFDDRWQPLVFTVAFVVPDNVRTYFGLSGVQVDRPTADNTDAPDDGLASLVDPRSLDIAVSFRTDEVSLVRGLMSDSGDALSVDGYLRFGIENNDAESRRESGNIRYSAVLGIGIALIVEAFVILLALGIRTVVVRTVMAGKASVDED